MLYKHQFDNDKDLLADEPHSRFNRNYSSKTEKRGDYDIMANAFSLNSSEQTSLSSSFCINHEFSLLHLPKHNE